MVAMPVTVVDGSPALKPSLVCGRHVDADGGPDPIGDLLRRDGPCARPRRAARPQRESSGGGDNKLSSGADGKVPWLGDCILNPNRSLPG